MRQHVLVLFLLVPVGCLQDDTSSTQGEIAPFSDDVCGNGDQDDSKTEGGELGVERATIDLGSRTVTFESWIAKTDSPGDYAGFTLSVSAGDEISFRVKAGGEFHEATGLSWMHPSGDGGSEVPGISHVDFCDDGDGGDGDGGDDGDDGDCIPDADTGECTGGDDGGGSGDSDGDGDGGGGDDCVPDVDTGECDAGDSGGDDGGVD